MGRGCCSELQLPTKGRGLVLGGNENRGLAMAIFPNTPKQEMPLYLLCLDQAQKWPVG